jgi:hypothetical protein
MMKTEKGTGLRGAQRRKAAVGVSTWKLVMILLAVVLVAALGAYKVQAMRTNENRAKIEYGFELGAAPSVPSVEFLV